MKVFRAAMGVVEGVHNAAADRVDNVERLRRIIARANGSETETDDEPTDRQALIRRLQSLARSEDRGLAEQLHLLVRFDGAELYKADGCNSMCMWADRYLGLARTACFDRLRVGRALAELPVLASLSALGQLSFSKLREIVRYATADTDAEFAAATLELSVSETVEYCRRFRHLADREADGGSAVLDGQDAADAKAVLRAFSRRSLSWRELDANSLRVTLDLPRELGAEWLASLEQLEDWIQAGCSMQTGGKFPERALPGGRFGRIRAARTSAVRPGSLRRSAVRTSARWTRTPQTLLRRAPHCNPPRSAWTRHVLQRETLRPVRTRAWKCAMSRSVHANAQQGASS